MHEKQCVINENNYNYKTDSFMRWMMNLKEIEKKLEKIPKNNIRRCFDV